METSLLIRIPLKVAGVFSCHSLSRGWVNFLLMISFPSWTLDITLSQNLCTLSTQSYIITYFATTVSRKLDFPPNRGLCCRQCRNKDSTIFVFWLPTTEGGRFTDLQSVRSSCSWRRFRTSVGSASCCSTNEKHPKVKKDPNMQSWSYDCNHGSSLWAAKCKGAVACK